MANSGLLRTAFHEDMIGEAIIGIVASEKVIERLEFMQSSLDSSQVLESHTEQLRFERTNLRNLKFHLNYLRRRLIDTLNERVTDYEKAIAITYSDAVKQEMHEVIRTLKAKIIMQQSEIDKSESELLPEPK